ncbi:hypothetical protein GLIP_3773 [Aliiglaciecola lipolytica E3]|uniref:Uncharacterized protein n=1 Tax=Aliiglaciecola lipolytica E3 TaxID=1127673 RepID=K6X710_9ALTE|nr:hypothetical protein GLIP_3773 [Aliiglaciecola lipolytica E3]
MFYQTWDALHKAGRIVEIYNFRSTLIPKKIQIYFNIAKYRLFIQQSVNKVLFLLKACYF